MDIAQAEQTDEVIRKPSLIASATKKMAVTYLVSTVCAATVVIIDSLVAGISIGQDALAAIAAAGPILAIDQILHCLLGFGIDKLMVQAIGEGDRRRANRIFGAILVTVLVVYALVFALLLLVERPLFQAMMGDDPLVDMVIDYTVPLFITSPLFEALLCIERAFRIDGRARLFSKRSIVTNVANILGDILMVSVLGLGVSGLAWASVLSTTIGYTITLSHFWSNKRTVSPDFSVVSKPEELLAYVGRDVRLGGTAALDEAMDSVALGAQTAAMGVAGGAAGLAIWAVYKSLRGVVYAASNGVSASVSVHAGLLFGQKDYAGVRYAAREGLQIVLMVSVGFILFTLLLAHPIATAYSVDEALRPLCARCLRIGCLAFPAIAAMEVTTVYLPVVNQLGLTSKLVLLQHGLVIVSSAFGYVVGPQGLFVAYIVATWACVLVLVFLLVRDEHWFVPERNPEAIAEYSLGLEPSQIGIMSRAVTKTLSDLAYPAAFCARASLLVEDSMSYIAQRNPDSLVEADVLLDKEDDGVLIAITDAGAPYNPLADVAKLSWREPGGFETSIMLGFTKDVTYDRVLDLNRMSLLAMPAAMQEPSTTT